MHIPLQEHWSPELLSELQRAVPVLERGSFGLADEEDDDLSGRSSSSRQQTGGRGSQASQQQAGRDGAATHASDGLRVSHGGLRLSDWAGDAAGSSSAAREHGVELSGLPSDLLSEDAMALPMSTLTSGKKKTFPNKSTFQAHVSCVMDPLQVPRVLETLQSGPQFKSVRSWSYAYRIISPFDGHTREGSSDDDDPGAGEKMLGLLQRMGLENLLLIMSRWDSGNPERLGAELFRCVNEQCKELLRELQQAVRASFPAEELMASHGQDDSAEGSASGLFALDSCSETTSMPTSQSTLLPGVFDLSALGGAAARAQQRAFHSANVFHHAGASPSRRLRVGEQVFADFVPEDAPTPEVPAELEVKKCALEQRPVEAASPRLGGGPSSSRRATAADRAAELQVAMVAAPSHGAGRPPAGAESLLSSPQRRAGSRQRPTEAACSAGGASERRLVPRSLLTAESLESMSTEELLKLGGQLHADRRKMEASLQELGDCTELLRKIDKPTAVGAASKPGAAAKPPMAPALPAPPRTTAPSEEKPRTRLPRLLVGRA